MEKPYDTRSRNSSVGPEDSGSDFEKGINPLSGGLNDETHALSIIDPRSLPSHFNAEVGLLSFSRAPISCRLKRAIAKESGISIEDGDSEVRAIVERWTRRNKDRYGKDDQYRPCLNSDRRDTPEKYNVWSFPHKKNAVFHASVHNSRNKFLPSLRRDSNSISFVHTMVSNPELSQEQLQKCLDALSHPRNLVDLSDYIGSKSLVIHSSKVNALFFEGNEHIKELTVDAENLTKLDVSDCLNLRKLTVSANNLITLDVSGCSNLVDVSIKENHLEEDDWLVCMRLVNENNKREEASQQALQELQKKHKGQLRRLPSAKK